MAHFDKRIDAYIAKSKDFAKPVLIHLRELVHKGCPDVEETMKWNFPHFLYKDAILCSMASFKEHCAFGFWKAALMKDSHKLTGQNTEAMGHMGRITSIKDLPADKVLLAYIKEAAGLNESGAKLPNRSKSAKEDLTIPDYLAAALTKNKKAGATFKAFTPGNKKEYITWLTEAKTETTRNKRLQQAIEWMAEGKIRNWKYVKA